MVVIQVITLAKAVKDRLSAPVIKASDHVYNFQKNSLLFIQQSYAVAI